MIIFYLNLVISVLFFFNFSAKDLSEDFLKKYYLTTKNEEIESILNSFSGREELIEDCLKKISREKIFEENGNFFTKDDINSVVNGYLDNKAAQVNEVSKKFFKEDYLEDDLEEFKSSNFLKRKRLEKSFISETTFFKLDDFSEIENVVLARIAFLKFLLSGDRKSKRFIKKIKKNLKEIREIEKMIFELQNEMKVEILDTDRILKDPAVSFFPGYLKLLPTNVQPTATYFLDKGVFDITKTIVNVRNTDPLAYMTGMKFVKGLFVFKTKMDLLNLIIPAYAVFCLGVIAYNNYYTLKKRFFVPKVFFEYSSLIRKKNKIIKSMYESFLELKKENEIFKFIPEVPILEKVINSKNCKEIEDDFYFGYYDRFVTTIKYYKILEFSNKLNEKYNFEVTKIEIPTEIYPFNVYEKFLGFIEFSLFKTDLIKESLAKEKNKYTIPQFYSYSREGNFNFEIKDLWHPSYEDYVSNDITLGFNDKKKRNALVIAPTGTGKSTFLTQLLALLIISRIGIVPAETAKINFPSNIYQNILNYNGAVGSGLSKHMAERVFVKEILDFAEKNSDKYFYLIADEICSGTTRSQTREFVNEYLVPILSKNNLTSFLTTHIEEVYENINFEKTEIFNIEVFRRGYEDFELTRKLRPGVGFWMEKEKYDAQNEFVRFLAKAL